MTLCFKTLIESNHDLVCVRRIGYSDLPDLFAHLSAPAIADQVGSAPQSKDDLARYVLPSSAGETSFLRLAITSRLTDRLIGTVGFHSVAWRHRSAEIAFDLVPEMWSKGIATYVCGLAVDWAHEEAGLVRVQATVLDSNLRSLAVLDRCGFVREGLLMRYRILDGQSKDFFMLSHVATA
ncbi:MAG: GNAT family protein [Caldimonas sp.]